MNADSAAPSAQQSDRPAIPIRIWIEAGALSLLIALLYLVGETIVITGMLLSEALPFCFLPSLLGLAVSAFRRRWAIIGLRAAVLTLALFTVLGFELRLPQTPEGPTLKVLAWNIQHLEGDRAGVIATIRTADPDILLLQECPSLSGAPNTARRFAAALPEYGFVRERHVWIGSKLPIEALPPIPLDTEPASQPAAHATITWQGSSIHLFSVHLVPTHYGYRLPTDDAGALELAQRRTAVRCREVRALLDALPRGELMILGGDMNMLPVGPPNSWIAARLGDSHDAAGSGFQYTFPSGFPLARIDRIYASDGLRAVQAEALNARASDHRPVITKYELARG